MWTEIFRKYSPKTLVVLEDHSQKGPMYCVIKCIVRGNPARVKNADLRHPSCTVVMYRRKFASPVHNVLRTLRFVRALCLCAPYLSGNTQPLFSVHKQLIGLCNGNEYGVLWLVIFVGFSVAPPTPSLRLMSKYYRKRSSFIRLFVFTVSSL